MKRLSAILILVTLLLSSVSLWANELVFDTDTLITDTLSVDTITDPEWYVAPGIPDSLRAPFSEPNLAPRRAAANSCLVDSILTFNIDSVLTEGTYYERDAAGRVVCTTIWMYNPDGSRIGKFKNEYGFDASGTQVMTAVYEWDAATNDWKGTTKYEYVYTSGRMTSNTTFVWIGTAWVADKRYTYQYDAAGRETEYYEYNRNTSTNQLEPTKGRIQTWYDATTKTLEIQYTAFKNGQPFTGTKTELGFDTEGNKILDASSTMVNGVWVGSSKEEWAYTDGVLTMRATYGWANGAWAGSLKETWGFDAEGRTTLHEQYGWYSNDWSMTLREIAGFDTYGNQTLIENYTGSQGVVTGVQYEQYTFDEKGRKILSLTHTWSASSNTWVNKYKEIWEFNGPKDTDNTLHEKYSWKNSDWSKTLEAVNEYQDGHLVRTESYKWTNGEKIGTKYVLYTYNAEGKKTLTRTYHWVSPAWVDSLKEEWTYTSKKLTLHEKYVYVNAVWTPLLQEITGYTSDFKYKTLVENYEWIDGVKTGVQKEETSYTTSGQKTQVLTYAWSGSAWTKATLEIWSPSATKPTLHEKYDYSGNDLVMTLQENTTYDGSTVVGVENYTRQGSGWSVMKEDYVYSGGQRTETIVYAYSNGAWEKSTRAVVGYTAGDTAVSATNYTWNGSTWIGSGTRTKTTTENGKVTGLLTQNWPDGATDWTNQTISQHTFNTDGEEVLTYNGTWNGTRWAVSSMNRTDYIFDVEGRQVSKTSWQCGADSIWKGVQKDTIKYSATGKILYSAQFKSWSDNNWVPVYKSEMRYDAADNTIFNQRYDWKNNRWVGAYWYEFRYDAAGKLTMQAQYSWSNNAWKGMLKSESGYAENGEQLYSISFSWKNNDWVYRNKTEYTRDNEGRLIEKKVLSYQNGAWVDNQWNTYTYDNKGNEIATSESYWVLNQWYLIAHTEHKYDDDSETKLRRDISESWNFGTLLSYVDKHYFYACDPRYYTVRFVNDDGTVLETKKWLEGTTPTYSGEEPTKAADDQNTYTFAGWDALVVAATGTATYTATYTATKKNYTITWLYDDGSLIDQTMVGHGVVPTHEGVTKPATDEYTYTFAGWDVTPVAVAGDATYTATFTATKRSYTITFKNGDQVLQSTAVEYGLMPAYTGATPTWAEDAQYSYTFTGWDQELSVVTGNATYTATYSTTTKSYTITWLNDDHTQIDQTTVLYGIIPTHADATKPETDEYTYTFNGWDVTPVAVTGEASYTATFTATKKTYTITFRNGDEVLQSTPVEYGLVPTYTGATPSQPSDAQYSYSFVGWDMTPVAVTGEATYTAVFDSVVNTYTVIFYFEDGVTEIDRMTLPYGATPSTNYIPGRNAEEHCYYSFAGWYPEIAPVTGNASYTPTYTVHYNEYTIIFRNYDRQELQRSNVPHGTMPSYDGAEPVRPRTAQYTYTFAGWTPELTVVEGNATYTATYESTVNSYTIIFLDEDGTELDRAEVPYGQTPSTAVVPTKEADEEYTYTFAGWSPRLTKVTSDATYTATYRATAKTDGLLDNTRGNYEAIKVLINGMIYIRRGEHVYSPDGRLLE